MVDLVARILSVTAYLSNNNYLNFDGRCYGEFQIIGEGTLHDPIKCDQQIRLRYLCECNTWMDCPYPEICGLHIGHASVNIELDVAHCIYRKPWHHSTFCIYSPPQHS